MNLHTLLWLEWCPLAELALNEMKANLQKKRGGEKVSYLLNYSFEPEENLSEKRHYRIYI